MKSVALIIITHLLVIAIRTAVVLNAPQSAPPPCVPAAANWKTLVACRTQTAQALTGTPTATATVLPVTATSTATTPGASRTPAPSPTRIRHNFVWCRAGSVTVERTGGYDVVECESP